MKTMIKSEITKLQWKWIIIGFSICTIIAGDSFFIVEPMFNSAAIQRLVMLAGFVAAGILIGYYSPGNTIKETTIAGWLTVGICLPLLHIIGTQPISRFFPNTIFMLLGIVFSLAGGWVGEKFEESALIKHESPDKFITELLWKWVLIGIVVGFVLNITLVFLLGKLFQYDTDAVFGMFSLSFILMGFIIGFKSPAHTIREPAIAGVIAVLVDYLLVRYLLKISVENGVLLLGVFIGFVLSLLGADIGENVQEHQRG